MGLDASLSSVVSFIISNVPTYTADTCKLQDESVFEYIQSGATNYTTCIVVDYGGFDNMRGGEFRSSMINWRINVNAFFMITEEYGDAFDAARLFLENIILQVSRNPFLSGGVMGAYASSGREISVYSRGNYRYLMAPLVIEVRDNIS